MDRFRYCGGIVVGKNSILISNGLDVVDVDEGADLEEVCLHDHHLYRMACLLDWDRFTSVCDPLYRDKLGTPVKDSRFFLALCYQKHIYRFDDEDIIDFCYCSPEWQYFAGETKFQKRWAIVPEDLSRWQGQIGDDILLPIMDEMGGIWTSVVSQVRERQDSH